ncbi:hypothetical protein BH20VER2_BH20VER2_07340 [soil metagenome]|nr:hypothetical protein [Chthoniobacterales bacterium]
MAADSTPNLPLEIGHVLFIDIVGYSKLLINEQSEVLRRLNDVVRGTEQVRAAEASGQLIRLPSGDGAALVFRNSPEAPAHCAIEISRALQVHPEVPVRMGIHSGPVNEIVDMNERANIAGAGINLAQRVMDCGDAGHILLSKRVADDLAQYRHWQPLLHDLGECEVKHGLRISIANLYTSEVGNPAVPTKVQVRLAEPARTAPSRGRAPLAAGIILAALAVAGVVWFLQKQNTRRAALTGSEMSSPAATPQPEPAAAGKRIAVLPFKPLAAGDRDQVLEIGMADTLIAKLSSSREIIVTSLTSVRKYGGLEQDPLAAGRALGVGSVLEGNVQKSGDHIRVTARLIKVVDGASLWAGTFDEKFTDVFSVQEAIARKVADALALSLSGEEKERLAKRETQNVGAYQLYMTGRYHWAKLTPPELTKAIGFFRQAIALDPQYALAYAGLADSYRALAPTSDAPPGDVIPQAKAAAQKAIALDDSLADPHTSLAFIHAWYDWDWAGAEREAKLAIALDPNSGLAHSAYANVLCDLGRFEEALAQAQRGREVEPVSLIVNLLEGSTLYYARRNEEAEARLRKTVELEPRFWIARLFLGKVLVEKKKYADALAEFSKAEEFSFGNSEAVAMTGYVAAISGETARARGTLQELLERAGQRYTPAYSIAGVYLGLGERDECFAWLEKALAGRDIRLSFLKVDPKWDEIRSDPRFASLLQRMGLE